MLQTWGDLSQNMGGAWAELKILSKNTCEGVHLIVKLPAISLQASKFTKNELLHTYFFNKDFRLLIIVLFLGIISWKSVSSFNGWFVFQLRGFIFKWGRGTHGSASVFVVGEGFEKNLKIQEVPPMNTMGSPA